MAKKKKKAKAKRKPTVQEQLLALCELVNKLSERVAGLQLEVARLRAPNPYQPPAPMPQYGTKPWKPDDLPPNEVLCQGPTGAVYLGRRGVAPEIVQVKKR